MVWVIPDPSVLCEMVPLVSSLISELVIRSTRLVIYNRVTLAGKLQLLVILSVVLRTVVYNITNGPWQQLTRLDNGLVVSDLTVV